MSNEDNGLPPPADPSALKSLLNPIPNDGAATPSSVVPEPPRSPRPDISAAPSEFGTGTNGNGVAQSAPPPPLATSEVPFPGVNGSEPSLPPLPIDAPVPPSPKAADEPPPTLPAGAIPPAVSTPTVLTDGLATTGLDVFAQATPLPEAAPAAVVGEITPILPTPAITAEPVPELQSVTPAPVVAENPAIAPEPAVPASAPAPVEAVPAPASAVAEPVSAVPSGVIEPAPTPAQATLAPPPASTSMDMDVDQPEPSPAASLKRPGDELEGGDEKRVRDGEVVAAPSGSAPDSAQPPAPPVLAPAPVVQAPAPSPQPPVPAASAPAPPPAADAIAPTPAPLVPGANPPIGVVPVAIPPEPVASGPTTPLTITQHKHMLNAVRGLKKNKDGVFFLEPVDPVKFNIPAYPQIITKPMDLATVETKLIVSDPRGAPKDKSRMGKWDESKGRYSNVAEITLDVRQIFWNTARFNGMEHLVTQAAKRLDAVFTKNVNNIPPEPMAAPIAAPPPVASPAAGPSHSRRPSVSHPPTIRRTSETTDRPKREIHPPPSKDLSYADAPRKPKRRNDPQLQWVLRTIKALESTNKTFDVVSHFLYPVEELVKAIPDYALIIKQPMDLNIIKNKLTEGEYEDVAQVDSDIKLMIANALKYNPAQDPVHIAANQLQQLWAEKLKSIPARQESRESSEDPLGGSVYGPDSDDENDENRIAGYQSQITELEGKIARIRSQQAQRRASRPKKSKKAGPSQPRKQSTARASPTYGNGTAKKPRKSRDVGYREDDDDEIVEISSHQKEVLAEKIQSADPETLNKALEIIARTQNVASDGEIELDIEALPPRAVYELYTVVVGPLKKSRKSNYVPNGRKPGRRPGGARKSMNEAEEQERIARMEAQLQSFGDSGRVQATAGYDDNDSESSEEEDSDLD